MHYSNYLSDNKILEKRYREFLYQGIDIILGKSEIKTDFPRFDELGFKSDNFGIRYYLGYEQGVFGGRLEIGKYPGTNYFYTHAGLYLFIPFIKY